jgi:hypothetical protein
MIMNLIKSKKKTITIKGKYSIKVTLIRLSETSELHNTLHYLYSIWDWTPKTYCEATLRVLSL